MARRIAIVGAGMLGLTLALRLRAAGHDVAILEAAPEIGGLASAWEIGGVAWDRHYHVILMSDLHTRGVLRDVGVENTIQWVTTKTGCYSGGRLHSVSNVVEFLRFPPLRMIDKFRLAATIALGSRIRDWRSLEQQTVSEWLTRWSGARTYETFWLPLLRSKLGESYRETSAAFIWATIQRLYAARRTRQKKEMFGYVPGGYATILARFAEVLRERGVEIRLGCAVDRVVAHSGRVAVHPKGGAPETFDQVVVTSAPALAAKLCPDLPAAERARLEAIRYLGVVCTSVLRDRKLSDFYVTNITDPGAPFTGVIEMTALVDPKEFGGRHLLYLPRYVTPDDDFPAQSDDEIHERFVGSLERMYPSFGRDSIVAMKTSRVRYVMPIPTIDYSLKVSDIVTSLPGIFLANSSQIINGTLNVNETVQLADRAAAKVLAA